MNQNYYISIHPSIMSELNITANQHLVASHITNRSIQRGHCWESKRQMANELFLSRKTIIRIINEVEQKGLITKHEGGRILKPTDYWLMILGKVTPRDKMSPSRDNMSPGRDKMTPDNGDKMSLGVGTKCPPNIKENNKEYNNKVEEGIGPQLDIPNLGQILDYSFQKNYRDKNIEDSAQNFMDYYESRNWLNVYNWRPLFDKWFRGDKKFNKNSNNGKSTFNGVSEDTRKLAELGRQLKKYQKG